MFKIVKCENIENKIKQLVNIRLHRQDKNLVVIDSDIDEMLKQVYLKCNNPKYMSDNDMIAVVDIIEELKTTVPCESNNYEPAYNLVNFHQFINKIIENNIKLSNYKFNWFIERWGSGVNILLFNDNEIIIFN